MAEALEQSDLTGTEDGGENLVRLMAEARRNLATQRSYAKEKEMILQAIPEALVVVDREARVTYLNHSAERMFGGQSTGVPLMEWPETFGLFLEDGKTIYPGISELLSQAWKGGAQEGELILQPSGQDEPRWISLIARPLKEGENQPSAVILIFQDINRLKQATLQLQKRLDYQDVLSRFSTALNAAGSDLDSILNAIAQRASESVGDACTLALLDEEQEILQIRAFHHPDPEARALLHTVMVSRKYDLDQGLIGGVLQSGEVLLLPSIPPDKVAAVTPPEYAPYFQRFGITSLVVVPLVLNGKILGILQLSRDNNGKPYTLEDQAILAEMAQRGANAIDRARLLASLQAKIEQLLSAQKSLQSNEAQFRTIFDSSPTGMMLLDMDGRIVQSNAQLGRILGYTAWELIGRFLSDLISPQAIPVFERYMRDFLQGAPGKRQVTSRFQRRDGQTVWGELDLGVVRNEAGEPLEVVGMLADITDRKEMESEIQEMNRKLLDSLESERLRLAQELHDGPIQELHSISYQIEALRQNAASADPQTLAELKNAVMKTIRSLRETAKELRPPALMDFGLEKAIRSHLEDIHEKYPQLKITLELSPDRDQLPEETRVSLFRIYQQAMVNVVRHARASEVRVRFTYDAEEIVLSIEDNGCGFTVPRHWIDLIRQGHFGLAGAAERVQALGGVFEVRTDPGKGTRLSAFIPRQPFEEKAG